MRVVSNILVLAASRITGSLTLRLLPSNGNVENGPLAIDQQKRYVAGFDGVRQSLKGREIRDRLSIQF